MKLLTKELEKKLPALYETDEIPVEDKTCHVKFFTPWSNWTWYATEYSPEDRLFFGYVCGMEKEWGYFSLDELESVTGPVGLKIERDIHFGPVKMDKVLKGKVQ